MKPLIIAALLGSTGLAAPAWACSPPPPMSLQIPLPPGPDGKLPVVQPDIDPDSSGQPPEGGPGTCPTPARHTYTGTAGGLGDSEVIARLNAVQPIQLAQPWQAEAVYVAGDRVSYAGANYTARWWNQNEAPGALWGAWQQEADGSLQAWSTTRAYTAGERVIFNDKIHEARWWTQGEQPGAEWGAWVVVGDAPAGNIDPARLPPLFSAKVQKHGNMLTVDFQSSYAVIHRHIVTAACTVRAESEAPVPAAFWRIRLDGVTAHEAPITENLSSGTLPPPPAPLRLPDGSCSHGEGAILQTNAEGRIQRATATVPEGESRFISVWSCSAAGDCRPSTLLEHQQMGKQVYFRADPPYVIYVPTP